MVLPTRQTLKAWYSRSQFTLSGCLPVDAISDGGEQEVVSHLNLGESPMPNQPRPNFPVVGLAAGTPILTPSGHKPIEDIKPGYLI